MPLVPAVLAPFQVRLAAFGGGLVTALLVFRRGGDVGRLKTIVVVLVALAVGAAVAATGIIGFVGIVTSAIGAPFFLARLLRRRAAHA